MRISSLITAVVAATFFVSQAHGAITINMQESDGDVVFSYSGSLDIAGLTSGASGTGGNSIHPQVSGMVFGGYLEIYFGVLLGPTEFGPGSLTNANVGNAGDAFASIGGFNELGLPFGYVSGTEIGGTMTFQSTDFSTLGIDTNTGPYVWTLTNAAADTITLQVVPEPTSALFFCSTGALACLRRRRQRHMA